MDYHEVLRRARERIGPKCKVCPECNGLGCGNTMPGPGSKAPGSTSNGCEASPANARRSSSSAT